MGSVGGQVLTVAEVAALMRVSKMTVYRLLHSGDLPGIRFGRSFRIPEQALTQYIEARLREENASGAA